MLKYILLNIFFLIVYFYYFYKMRHGIHMLQLEYYRTDRYMNWVKKNKKIVFCFRDILLIISSIVMFFNIQIGLILGIIFAVLLYISRNIYQEKKPLGVTGRVKRIFVTETLLFLIFVILGNVFLQKINIILLLFAVFIILSYFIVLAINIINKPIEKSIQYKFYRKAKNKLKEMKQLKIIGITGSYGKTSTKYVLSTILEQKYNVLMTPASYNTKMGVVRTINEYLKPIHQVFVCEMGADKVGEIQELCDLVHPSLGVLTSIGPQHLETFKTIENVIKTKFELVNSLPQDGIAFINYEDENIKKTGTEKINIKFGFTKDTCDYYADNLVINEKGSTFDIHTKKGEQISVKTKLLGKHNIINIVGAVSVAKELGLTNEEIQRGIKMLRPVPHRLELKSSPNGSIIIDDAYNSNTKGAEMALEVLGKFKDKKRILITPGIVELGSESHKYNKLLGKQAAKNADYVILVGEKQATPIYEGLTEEGFDNNQIYIAKTLEDAIKKMNEVMSSNSVILLENDLSDNYL